MKKSFTKIALVLLSVALLVGSVIGISVSAAEDGQVEILAQNIVYGEKVSIAYAVNASLADAVNGTVKVSYYWEEDGVATLKSATLLDTTDPKCLYNDGTTDYPVFVTEGVAAKELTKVAFAVAYTGEAAPAEAEYSTYSAVQYLYARLYKDGFVNKTDADGKDYNRKLLYQNLLAYGTQAQLVLDYNTDKLASDYTYVYTTSEQIKIGEGNFAFGYGELAVSATSLVEQKIAGWTVTNLNTGDVTTSEDIIITLNGAYSIEPIFGVHECVDEDNDHLCDSCGEIVSECADLDKNHFCDVCNVKLECVDANTDCVCDICSALCFENSLSTGVHLATGSAVLQESFIIGETYTPATKSGFWGNIVQMNKVYEGGRTEVSNVLKIVCNDGSAKNTSINTLGSVYFTPSLQNDDGGNIHVIEFDYNWSQSAKTGWRNPFTFMAWDASGNALGEIVDGNGNDDKYCVTALNNGGAFTEGSKVENAYQLGISGTQSEAVGGNYSLLDSDTWYRLRVVYDQSTGTLEIAGSNDGGNTWYKVCKQQSKKAYADCDYLTISFTKPYGHGGIMYFDNINYNIVTTAPVMPATNGK